MFVRKNMPAFVLLDLKLRSVFVHRIDVMYAAVHGGDGKKFILGTVLQQERTRGNLCGYLLKGTLRIADHTEP